MPLRLFLLFYTTPLLLGAQIDPVAEAIKPNVVAIKADFPSGEKEQGFGFVVGERNGLLYLATAGHVVREDGAAPGKENADNIQVVFCGDDRSYTARILKATISPFDFGLLELSKPLGYVWKADCLGTKPTVGTSVGYIGRNNICYIPSAAVRGTVNRIMLDRIAVDINGISRGTSGAPLLGSNGLVGMIVHAESAAAGALTLERLREEITNEGDYPFRFGLRLSTLIPQTPDNTTIPNPNAQDLQNWRNTRTKGTRQAYQDYLNSNPTGNFAQHARDSILAIDGRAEIQRRRAAEIQQEQDDWDLATELSTLSAYEDYLRQHPSGKNAPEARKRRDALRPSPDIATYNMVKIDGGTFEMGCKPERDGTCNSDETPLHQVSISPFYLSRYEVTYQQFKTFVDSTQYQTDAEKKGYIYIFTGHAWEKKTGLNWRHDVQGQTRSTADYQHPVVHLSQNDAKAYCQWLSKQTGKEYRLPTEAEWEFSARGGKLSKTYRYAGSNDLEKVAWHWGNSDWKTHVVGQKKANELGLFDMSGNVWEWCSDQYDVDYYKSSPNIDPTGAKLGTYAVLRGGSWNEFSHNCRLAERRAFNPLFCVNDYGFRLARNL